MCNPAALPRQEQQVLERMAQGLTNKSIGRQLGLAENTIKTYAQRLYRTLGATDRAHAVAIAYQRGHLRLPTPCPTCAAILAAVDGLRDLTAREAR